MEKKPLPLPPASTSAVDAFVASADLTSARKELERLVVMGANAGPGVALTNELGAKSAVPVADETQPPVTDGTQPPADFRFPSVALADLIGLTPSMTEEERTSLQASLQNLAQAPTTGRPCHLRNPRFRAFRHIIFPGAVPLVLVCRPARHGIDVIRILPSQQDWSVLFT